MAYTAAELINRAWYLSGIVARSLETPTGQQINDGLSLLNDLLSFQTVDNSLVPYYNSYDFNGVVGQEEYFIPGLIEIETLSYVYSTNVRYAMIEQTRAQYFGTPRVNGIDTLPAYFHMEKEKGGGNLFMYFTPDQAYPFTIWGKFGLTEVTYETDLSLTYDRFYLKYLRYALAAYICSEEGFTTPAQTRTELEETIAKLKYLSPLDFTVTKISSLQNVNGLNWGQINLGRGWTTA